MRLRFISAPLIFLVTSLSGLAQESQTVRVGVALMGLVPHELHQPDLFEKPRDAKLVNAIDAVNEKFGKGALVYGDATPEHTSKIAFQRVPKVTEF